VASPRKDYLLEARRRVFSHMRAWRPKLECGWGNFKSEASLGAVAHAIELVTLATAP
jgi:hypothetical protein